MTLPKFHNQPLGTMKQLDRIIQSFPPEQFHEQTRNLTIIYAKRKLQVQVPIDWTVNKLKCMMAIHFETLSFDKFEFQCNKFLIPGKTTVVQLPNEELIVTQADCPKAFETYYKEKMKKVIKKYDITTQNFMYPITHRSLSQDMMENIPKGRIANIHEIPENRQRQEPQGMMIINILRIIGIAFMSNLIFTFASFGQIAILLCIAIVYYLIDEYVKYNDRKRREQEKRAQQEVNKKKQQANVPNTNENVQNQRLQQVRQQNEEIKYIPTQKIELQSQERQIKQENLQFKENSSILKETLNVQEKPKTQRKILKARIIYWTAFLAQFLYCYFLSVFPNWTVETHLHANQEKLDKVMDKIKKLDPQTSQAIKKWEVKGIDHSFKAKNQDQKMKEL